MFFISMTFVPTSALCHLSPLPILPPAVAHAVLVMIAPSCFSFPIYLPFVLYLVSCSSFLNTILIISVPESPGLF